jgi:hypothetical protein
MRGVGRGVSVRCVEQSVKRPLRLLSALLRRSRVESTLRYLETVQGNLEAPVPRRVLYVVLVRGVCESVVLYVMCVVL